MSKIITTGWITDKINGIAVSRIACSSKNYAPCSSRTVSFLAVHYTGNAKDTATGNGNHKMLHHDASNLKDRLYFNQYYKRVKYNRDFLIKITKIIRNLHKFYCTSKGEIPKDPAFACVVYYD